MAKTLFRREASLIIRMKMEAKHSKKYTKNSFRAYLRGETACDEKWIEGVIKSSNPEDVIDAIDELSIFEGRERFITLRRMCGLLGDIG
jgi:hypothetical protein